MNHVLIDGIENREIVIADYHPFWPEKFQKHAAIIVRALGPKAVRIEHVGSSSPLWHYRKQSMWPNPASAESRNDFAVAQVIAARLLLPWRNSRCTGFEIGFLPFSCDSFPFLILGEKPLGYWLECTSRIVTIDASGEVRK